MGSKKKLRINNDESKVVYMNWLAQVANMIQPKNLFAVVGRGGAKTTDILAERTMSMVYDMPGSPIGLISDTYTNLQRNIIKTLVEALVMKGWVEGIHFVIGKEPPKHFKRPNHAVLAGGYKHTICYFNGTVDHALSLDRASIGAGNSYVALKGDEAKYLKPDLIANLTKAIRGYRDYSVSPYYRGLTFTTDMPDMSKIGQYDWILHQGKNMDRQTISLLMQTAFHLNDLYMERQLNEKSYSKDKKILSEKNIKRWEDRFIKLRYNSTFFYIASSFINSEILTADYFRDEFGNDMGDVLTGIMSIQSSVNSGDRFYHALNESHFYIDGNNSYWSETFGINDTEDCRILRYLNKDKPIEAGLDTGKMDSLSIAQPGLNNIYRILKFMYALKPYGFRELADEFIEYFSHHNNKTLYLWYDRAANNYKSTGQSDAEYFKQCIMKKDGKSTGWNVILQSIGQGNITSNLEYRFMEQLMSGHNKAMPKLLIDQYNCKSLKCSIELARTKIQQTKNGSSMIVKDKRSESLPVARLPFESTNPSDSFKYLLCRREFLKLMTGAKVHDVGNLSVH